MVKVTPAHDPNDFEIAKRTGLEVLNILTPEAAVNDNAPEAFRGMDRFDARKAVVRALEKAGLFAGAEVHRHSVPHCYRCDTVVEPRLSEQWFVKMRPLASPRSPHPATAPCASTRSGGARPTRSGSRTSATGASRGSSGGGTASRSGPASGKAAARSSACARIPRRARPAAASTSSRTRRARHLVLVVALALQRVRLARRDRRPQGLLPRPHPGHRAPRSSSSGWPAWSWRATSSRASRPFTDVFLHGTVRDAQGRKMSKSLGNGIDPLEVVDRFGPMRSAGRCSPCAAWAPTSTWTTRTWRRAFAPGRNFANKLWNAGRFTLMSVGEGAVKPLAAVEADLETATAGSSPASSRAASGMTDGLERFRLHDVVERAHRFFWGDFADWYLEVVKTRCGAKRARRAARPRAPCSCTCSTAPSACCIPWCPS
jgi:valyl-tRNA synthetase